MIRIAILAAAGALLAGAASAQPADFSGPAIRVSTAGKAPVQVKADVYQAARKLCQASVPGYAYRYYEAKACIDGAARQALAQAYVSGGNLAAR